MSHRRNRGRKPRNRVCVYWLDDNNQWRRGHWSSFEALVQLVKQHGSVRVHSESRHGVRNLQVNGNGGRSEEIKRRLEGIASLALLQRQEGASHPNERQAGRPVVGAPFGVRA
ncbi:hypothetical protein KKD19_03905 [Patescibacteria group bacterium]|nr:hypothetical protein [Patescibacteria group bacterium]MBU4512351.1 hypothetical protein [Patescibacteria group bacterium]MCG2692778.1 hypothetical protein [Candidatus Parcubacteria bacterium]